MRKLKSIFNFQLKKAVNKRNALIYLFIAVILQIFLQVGKANQIDTLESNKTFQRQELQKASNYLHYRQYGTFGIWLKFVPHANRILFCDSIYDNLFCNANSTYVFNIYTPIKSRSVFASRSRFLNFSVMFFLFGVLACLVYGMDIFVRKDYLKFISNLTGMGKAFWITITARLIILFMAAIVLYAISVLPLLVFDGINLFSTSFPVLLVIILSFLFFFSIGCLIGLKEAQFTRALILGGVYFLAVILLPWVMGLYSELSAKDLPSLIEFDFRNFNVLMQEEENRVKEHGLPSANETPSEEALKDFKDGFIKMKKIFRNNEDKLRSLSLSKIKTQQTIASLFPTLFYFSICESSSSTGVNSYMDFHPYCQEKKEGFADFIMENSFPEKDKPLPEKVENFLKGDEDLFFAKPKLPYNFLLGIFLTVIYSIAMLLILYHRHQKRVKIPKPKISYQIPFKKGKGNVLFTHCENESIKTDILNHYRNQPTALCLAKIDISHFQFHGIKAVELFKHLCRISGTDEEKAIKNLDYMGIRDLSIFKPDEETILKIYTAVRTAGEYELIVLDDFLEKESKQFESGVTKLLLALAESGKKINYLSTESYDVVGNFDDIIKIDKFFSLPIDLNVVILR